MATATTVELKIQRFDPERDNQPHWQTLTVPVEPMDRVLDVLTRAKELFELKAAAQKDVLATEAEVVILDEPTANLDPTARAEVLDLVREANAVGRTVIFSSHVLSEVEATCDRVVILRASSAPGGPPYWFWGFSP